MAGFFSAVASLINHKATLRVQALAELPGAHGNSGRLTHFIKALELCCNGARRRMQTGAFKDT